MAKKYDKCVDTWKFFPHPQADWLHLTPKGGEREQVFFLNLLIFDRLFGYFQILEEKGINLSSSLSPSVSLHKQDINTNI